jgi:hypothetical protein
MNLNDKTIKDFNHIDNSDYYWKSGGVNVHIKKYYTTSKRWLIYSIFIVCFFYIDVVLNELVKRDIISFIAINETLSFFIFMLLAVFFSNYYLKTKTEIIINVQTHRVEIIPFIGSKNIILVHQMILK